MDATPVWESCKENAAPLQRGRNVATLERAASQTKKEKEEMIKHYEGLVRPSEAPHVTDVGDEDPLQHWLSYIKYYQDNFPSDSNEQFLLMERCTRALVKIRSYADNDKFIGVCAKYAEKTTSPLAVFRYLHEQKIGSRTALFWIAWAFVAEKEDDFPFAEKIFKKGISKNAQPLHYLKTRHKQFQRRMSRYWLDSTSRQEDDMDTEENDTGRRRGVLGGLSQDSVRRNHRSQSQRSRGLGHQGSRSQSTGTSRLGNRNTNNIPQQAAGFSIFVEQTGENAENEFGLGDSQHRIEKRVIESDADRRKENTLAAERWNERGGLNIGTSGRRALTRSNSNGPPPAFAVYVDEQCIANEEKEAQERKAQEERHRRGRDERTFKERTDEGIGEKLVKDPLRYVRDPSQFASDQALAAKKVTENSKKTHRKGDIGFNKRLLKDSSGKEQSFEEARACVSAFNVAKVDSNFNLLEKQDITVGSQMELDDDGSVEDASTADTVTASNHSSPNGPTRKLAKLGSLNDNNKHGRVLFNPDISFHSHHAANTSTASSAVNELSAVGIPMGKEEETINTKFAMKELSMMFSSPGYKGEKDEDDYAEGGSCSDMADLVGNVTLNNSIIDHNINDENNGPRNPLARTNATPGFDQMALKELQRSDGDDSVLGCGRANRPTIHHSQSNPLPTMAVEVTDDPGFQIFEDDQVESAVNTTTTGQVDHPREDNGATSVANNNVGGFDIFQDDDDYLSSSNAPSEQRPSTGFQIFDDNSAKQHPETGSNAFTIFEDNGNAQSDNVTNQPATSGGFTIFQDNVNNEVSLQHTSPRPPGNDDDRISAGIDDGNTASLSLLGDVFDSLVLSDENTDNVDDDDHEDFDKVS